MTTTSSQSSPPELPVIRELNLENIEFAAQNPRQDDHPALEGLAKSMGVVSDETPMLAQFPLVEEIAPGVYRVIAGARRVRAAKDAGWKTMPCVVRQKVDVIEAHQLRLVENMHREPLHPLDEALALKVSWAIANCAAMRLEDEARRIMEKNIGLAEIIRELTALLEQHEIVPTHPPVTWDALLDRYGIVLSKDSRKMLMKVLAIDPSLHGAVRRLKLSEAAVRSIGTLEVEDQKALVEALVQDEAEHGQSDGARLARKIRRICRVVREQGYSLDEALAEAQGKVLGMDDDEGDGGGFGGGRGGQKQTTSGKGSSAGRTAQAAGSSGNENEEGDIPEEAVIQPIMELLEVANKITTNLDGLKKALAGRSLDDLPQPWGGFADDAINLIREAFEGFEHTRGG